MIVLLAELIAKPAAIKRVEEVLRDLVVITSEECGSLIYAVHRSESAQNNFMLYELYNNRSACDTHLSRQRVRDALARLKPLLAAAPKVSFFEIITLSGRSVAAG